MFKLSLLFIAVTAVWGLPNSGTVPLKKTGRLTPGGRIIGGHDADIADYPYQLSVARNGFFLCGASILGPKWALTAASSIYGLNAGHLSVIAGSADSKRGQVLNVATILWHPQYDKDTVDYDISVLELAEDITIENASPIALHDAGFVVEEGTAVTITGWGYLGPGGPLPDVLQVLVTNVISNEVCNESYLGLVTDRMMCTGNLDEFGDGPCYGDGGGPLVVNGKQYGIVSWGWGCAHYPGVHARVTEESIREFVKNITGI